jgi:predicted ATPase
VGPSTGFFDVGGQLVTPPIRGRAGELKVIGALLTALVQGHGGVLVIEGPPGIGKSRLLTEVMALADKSGVRTLFGEAFEYQQTVPFFALFMATLRADPPVGDAEALRRLGGSADLRYWVVHDLADAIRAAAAEMPLRVLCYDPKPRRTPLLRRWPWCSISAPQSPHQRRCTQILTFVSNRTLRASGLNDRGKSAP